MTKEEVVAIMVEYIEGLPDGEGGTTARIMEKLFPEYLDDGCRIYGLGEADMMNIHNEVFNRIKKNGKVIMDYSVYEDMDVGLPFHLIFQIVKKRTIGNCVWESVESVV